MVWPGQTSWTWLVSGRLGGLWQLLQRQADRSRVELYGHRMNADTLPPLDRSVCKPAGGRGIRASISARQSLKNSCVSVRGVSYTTSDSLCSSAGTLGLASSGTFSALLHSWCGHIYVSQSRLPCPDQNFEKFKHWFAKNCVKSCWSWPKVAGSGTEGLTL